MPKFVEKSYVWCPRHWSNGVRQLTIHYWEGALKKGLRRMTAKSLAGFYVLGQL